jgi:hypothetical protein
MVSTTLKTTMFAPMPRARMRMDVQHRQAARVAMPLGSLQRSAKVNQGLAASFISGHAVLYVFFDGHLQMGGHFGIEIVIELIATEERQEALKRLAEPVDHELPFGSKAQFFLKAVNVGAKAPTPGAIT